MIIVEWIRWIEFFFIISRQLPARPNLGPEGHVTKRAICFFSCLLLSSGSIYNNELNWSFTTNSVVDPL